MEIKDEGLVKKIFWTDQVDEPLESDRESESILRCSKLEEEGFGMLASKFDCNLIDETNTIVCPDGSVLTPKEIIDYWSKRGGYSSKNFQDIKMHKARVYYLGFKGEL
jgi:hypothetical protein